MMTRAAEFTIIALIGITLLHVIPKAIGNYHEYRLTVEALGNG